MYVRTHTIEGKKDLESNFHTCREAVTIIALSVTALRLRLTMKVASIRSSSVMAESYFTMQTIALPLTEAWPLSE